jgi:hypothetical protein
VHGAAAATNGRLAAVLILLPTQEMTMKLFSITTLALALMTGLGMAGHAVSAQPDPPAKAKALGTPSNPKTGLKALANIKPKTISPKFTDHIEVSASSGGFTVTGSGLEHSAMVTIRVTRVDTLQSVTFITNTNSTGQLNYSISNPGNLSGALLNFGATTDGGATWSNVVQVSCKCRRPEFCV